MNPTHMMPNPYNGKVLMLGCGRSPMEGAINHDQTAFAPWVDLAWNLDEMPWKLGDNYAAVVAYDVLEHLVDPYGAVNEVHALLAEGGVFVFRMASWDNPASYNDLTHKHFVAGEAFDFFDKATPRGAHYSAFHPIDTRGRTPTDWHIEYARRVNPDPRFGVGDIEWKMVRE